MKRVWLLFVVGSILLTAGCATTQVSPNAVDLAVDFVWQPSDRCSNRSPEIRVANIPSAAKTLWVKLKDRDVPTWNHGGGNVTYDQAMRAAGSHFREDRRHA